MKIFFLASISASDDLKKAFNVITDATKELGHEVHDSHVIETNEQLLTQSEEFLEKRARQLMNTLLSCDALVFEGTTPSTGCGYYISAALQRQIPVLFLTTGKYTGLYLGDPDRLLKFEIYNADNKDQLKNILTKFFAFANKRGLNNRFNMMIDDATEDYLNEISKKMHISKSDYVRNLIIQNIEEKENS